MRLLILETNENLRLLYKEYVEYFSGLVTGDPEEALDYISDPVDIVICNYRQSTMDFLRKSVLQRMNCKTYIFTGSNIAKYEIEREDPTNKINIENILEKPMGFDVLLENIKG